MTAPLSSEKQLRVTHNVRCEHYACRCHRARELLVIYDRTQQGRYLREAVEVHSQSVSCRELP